MKLIGIDPGINGGLAFFNDKKLLAAIKMPSYNYTVGISKKQKKRQMIDGKEVAKLFKTFNPDFVFIEKVGAMPKQGVTSTFNFGFSTGILHGVCSALNLNFETVRPQEWKKIVIDDTEKDKEAAILFCETNYPNISLLPTKRSKKPHDGIADAICIAVYGLSKKIIINKHIEEPV